MAEEGADYDTYLQAARRKRSLRDDFTPDMLLDQSSILLNKTKHSCHRCHRLKKKCLKEFPSCLYCIRTSNDCFYLNKSIIRNKPHGLEVTSNNVTSDKVPLINGDNDHEVKSSPQASAADKHHTREGGHDHESFTVLRNWIHKDADSFDGKKYATSSKSPTDKRLTLTHASSSSRTDPGDDNTVNDGHSTLSHNPTINRSNNPFDATIDKSLLPPPYHMPYQGAPPAEILSPHQIPPHKILKHKNLSIQSLLLEAIPNDYRQENNRVNGKLLTKSLKLDLKNDEEFMTLNNFPDNTLPLLFVKCYFHNYEHHHPIFDKELIMQEFSTINFKVENIVKCYIYLILSIGCLIHDSLNNDKLFTKYFNENLIDSIIDVTNFNQKHCDNEFEINNLKVLILLTNYYMNKNNEIIVSNMITILNRLILKFNFYKMSSSDKFLNIKNAIFWTVINMDYEFNLIVNKPTSNSLNLTKLLDYQHSKLQLLTTNHGSRNQINNIEFLNQIIRFNLLQNKLNDVKLVTEILDKQHQNIKQDLLAISKEVETWRVNSVDAINVVFNNDERCLKQFSLAVNLHYFYLLIEVDQLSSTKSSEFSLQFLSTFFQIALLADDKINNNIRISLTNIIHLYKLFNVVKYNLINLRLTPYFKTFKVNIPIILNLLKYLNNHDHVVDGGLIDHFERLNDKLNHNNLDSSASVDGIIDDILAMDYFISMK